MSSQTFETKSRLLAKLIREALATESFESITSLADVVKYRCARLRIRWAPDDLTNAFRLIASNRDLVVAVPAPTTPDVIAPAPDLQRDEARVLYAQIVERYQREHADPTPAAPAPALRPPDFPDLVRVREW